jgi:hypothetical protein
MGAEGRVPKCEGGDLAGRNPGEEGERGKRRRVLGATAVNEPSSSHPGPGSSPTRTRAKLQGGFDVGSIRSWFHRSTSMHSALLMFFAPCKLQ